VNRLTSAQETGGADEWNQAYGYDQWGNRAVSGNYIPNAYATPTSLSQYTNNQWLGTGAAYTDGKGNQTNWPSRTFNYDGENRLVASMQPNMGPISYVYDGDGRRVQKTVGSAVTNYVYDSGGQLAAEYGTSATFAGTDYLMADALGSTRVVLDATGSVKERIDYLPFGEEIATPVGGRAAPYTTGVYPSNPDIEAQKFTGKERDAESGLDYFGARHFHAPQGRFVVPDEAFADQLVSDPQSWNLYAYARDNPLRFVDNTGHGVVSTAVSEAERYFLKLARQRGVDRAWALERELVRRGLGTVEWTEEEKAVLLAGGRPPGWVGHHINSVAGNSVELAEDPRNIKFVKGIKAHLEEHENNFRNKTSGALIDRLSKLAGPALLVFFEVYDEKVRQYTAECRICANPDSWWALVNPWNTLVEQPALLEALVAADAEQRELDEAQRQGLPRRGCASNGFEATCKQ
jgi:RHS repeat-associated protein